MLNILQNKKLIGFMKYTILFLLGFLTATILLVFRFTRNL